ncbi:hypothetical protein E2C01_065859 [Portunus trituberculatus]|uniref:Uncharacterized protein n=1 Tax=Portunus trituberculatus TaxID=210409 RepID=A0A5B7HPF7_PORTR|nr:hypothetical protein [Portunus trituberculatus]
MNTWMALSRLPPPGRERDLQISVGKGYIKSLRLPTPNLRFSSDVVHKEENIITTLGGSLVPLLVWLTGSLAHCLGWQLTHDDGDSIKHISR